VAFKKCECGNNIDPRDMGEDATQCEWCEYPSMDWVMWRERDTFLEQMETHGMDKYFTVPGRFGGTISVWANSLEIAQYIAEQYEQKEYA